VLLKVWIGLIPEFAAFALLLFWPAGTLDWIQAWAMLGLFFGFAGAACFWLARHDPALLAERMRFPFQRGEPLWVSIGPLGFSVLFGAWFVLMALDARRFQWSEMGPALNLAGAVGMVVAFAFLQRVFRENTFLAPVVRVQRERGHRVISTGPYALVRHPMYAGAALLLLSMALLLGSWAGVAGALVITAAIAFRAVAEERLLMRNLEGYAEYASRVRWRLIPGVW
jgi:protein-S-isoprenylcysteine O-methyltransferase Ste14